MRGWTRETKPARWGRWLALVAASGLMAAIARAGDDAAAGDEPCDGACCAAPSEEQLAQGRELFLREWVVGDGRARGGDGLGPVFNDSSCVACHNAGGPGGGGPNSKNVDILTASHNGFFTPQVVEMPRPVSFLDRTLEALLGVEPPAPRTMTIVRQVPHKPDRAELIRTHAGFRTANSVVLHRFGTEPDYESWRNTVLGMGGFVGSSPMFPGMDDEMRGETERSRVKMLADFERNNTQFQGQAGEFSLLRSQRNPTALYGDGLIDAIPDAALLAAAEVEHEGFPEVAGRVSRQKDGRLGRFGWKGQTPGLEDFVLTACAVELGLEVPGHPQGGLPQKPDYRPEGLDLTAEECASLTAYVRNLPRPGRVNADHGDVRAGERLFSAVGCATCHAPKLGDVEGLYSDLLLHDMGPELGDVGQYGVFTPESSDPEIDDAPQVEVAGGATTPVFVQQVAVAAAPAEVAQEIVTQVAPTPPIGQVVDGPIAVATTPAPLQAQFMMGGMMGGGMMMGNEFGIAPNRPKDGPASRQEWKTPPLWGLRDSAPYLHDGRAATIERAIALHGGEGTRSARKYFALSPRERMQVEAFLKSLTAPEPTSLARAGN